ncbi:hypothetical protein SBDP1_240022 [Syntrophobacter sp. SbD1]|nr:hypothetical protein SBDP1_240022 [Syntrophobacter sp. SbD1]
METNYLALAAECFFDPFGDRIAQEHSQHKSRDREHTNALHCSRDSVIIGNDAQKGYANSSCSNKEPDNQARGDSHIAYERD